MGENSDFDDVRHHFHKVHFYKLSCKAFHQKQRPNLPSLKN
jgi:hypothetical protein